MIRLIARELGIDFGSGPLFSGLSFEASSERPCVVSGRSGSGKTTLLRILAGLEKADQGSVSYVRGSGERIASPGIGMVFQEDRLLGDYDAVRNVTLVSRAVTRDAAEKELLKLLPRQALSQPVKELSGGMRRRVCIVRAMLAPSDAVLFDEPLAGLDEENRALAAGYILENTKERLIVIASHFAEEFGDAQVIRLDGGADPQTQSI